MHLSIINQLKTFQYFVYAASKDLDISKIISEVEVNEKCERYFIGKLVYRLDLLSAEKN
jgi:hypothetical protein